MNKPHKMRPLFTWRSAIASPVGPKNPTTRHVLLTLSLHMNERGESCYPSTKVLAAESGLSERSVCTHLDQAERDGWIVKRVLGRSGQGWRRHLYCPVVPPHALKDLQCPEDEGAEADAPGTEARDEDALKDVQSSTSINTPSNTAEGARKRNAPATSVPRPFEITPALRDWADAQGIPAGILVIETENFVDHHLAKGNVFSDWQAAWRKWMRNAKKWNGGSHERQTRSGNSAIEQVRQANARARFARGADDGDAERIDD